MRGYYATYHQLRLLKRNYPALNPREFGYSLINQSSEPAKVLNLFPLIDQLAPACTWEKFATCRCNCNNNCLVVDFVNVEIKNMSRSSR